MSEQTQVAASVQPTTLTVAEAAQRYAESKVAKTEANPVSEAARTLGQRAAQARQERTTQAAAQAQEPDTGAQHVEDEPAVTGGEPQDEVVTEDTPTESTEANDDPASGTIDLGDGVSMTVAEVRESILLKADHTRRLQKIAERSKELDARESQRLAQLDEALGVLQSRIGQPKTMKQWISELGHEAGLERFAEQSEQLSELNRARGLKNQAEQRAHSESLDQRDKQLAESYNKEWADPAKRDAHYTKLTAYALKQGFAPEEVKGLTQPHHIVTLDKAAKYDELMASKANVTKLTDGKPPVVKPGAKVSAQASKHTSIAQAHQRLKTSGSIADAVALLRARRGG